MATLFNQEIVNLLTPVFVFIFVFAALYTLLMRVKFFGDKPGFNLVIAFASAMLIFLTPQAHVVITSFTPWMALFTLLLIFIFVFFLFIGVKEKTLEEVATGGTFAFWMCLIVAILFLVALTKAYGPFLMTNQNPGFWNSAKRVIFHPKTLGVFFVLAIAAYTIRYIGSHE